MQSSFFAVFLSLGAYQLGLFIKKRLKFAIFNPLLLSIIFIISTLLIFEVPYENFKINASQISFFLTPITICLAVPLYEQIELLKQNYLALLSGIIAGALAGFVSLLALAFLFNLDPKIYISMLSKSVTMPIGISISQQLQGMINITVGVILLTGILGSVIADFVFKIARIKKGIAKGIALGSASHAIGTAKAIELGDVEAAMASLAMAVTGVISIIGAGIFAKFY